MLLCVDCPLLHRYVFPLFPSPSLLRPLYILSTIEYIIYVYFLHLSVGATGAPTVTDVHIGMSESEVKERGRRDGGGMGDEEGKGVLGDIFIDQ